jgi:hypothetical protein
MVYSPQELPKEQQMSRNVMLDDDVFEYLQRKAVPLEDDINSVLRRELKLPISKSVTAVEVSADSVRRIKNMQSRVRDPRYNYSEGDDVVALYIYKYGDGDLPQSTDTIGASLGMGSNSLRMRISNFRAIDTDGREGLRNWARQSEAVYRHYGDSPRDELRQRVLRHLNKSVE